MTEETKDNQVELLRINVEVGWKCAFNCEDCYRYFQCPSLVKYQIYEKGRFGRIQEKLKGIKHILAVMSGKGGVGKSTVSANLAVAFAQKGFSTYLLDSDFFGPSIPKILGIKEERVKIGPKGIIPASGPLGIKVISTAFLMDKDEHITWFHKLKRGALEEFLVNVDFGEALDCLILDLPPGTGSETLNMLKLIPRLDGAVVVTVPSEVSQGVAKRGISILNSAKVPIIGVIENMSGFVCPKCHKVSQILQQGGGERLAEEMAVPFLGRIPMDQKVSGASDSGSSFIVQYADAPASKSFVDIMEKVESFLQDSPPRIPEYIGALARLEKLKKEA